MSNPIIIAHFLRRMAKKIEDSKNPSLSAVRADLKKVLVAVRGEAREAQLRRIAAEIIKIAQEEFETSMWDTDEGKAVDFAYGEAKRKHGENDNLDGALTVLKRKVDTLIEEIRRDPAAEDDKPESPSSNAPPPPSKPSGPFPPPEPA